MRDNRIFTYKDGLLQFHVYLQTISLKASILPMSALVDT